MSSTHKKPEDIEMHENTAYVDNDSIYEDVAVENVKITEV